MGFAWKILIPLGLVNIGVVAADHPLGAALELAMAAYAGWSCCSSSVCSTRSCAGGCAASASGAKVRRAAAYAVVSE